jgi:outer membrane lipopolysaccharide assembly protein LptE/RlpB
MTFLMRVIVYSIILPAHSYGFYGQAFVLPTRERFLRQSLDDNDIVKAQQQLKTQEMVLNELSKSGASKIATISIPERAKRALLAEAIEDQIIRLTDEMEQMIGVDGIISKEYREKEIETATRMKELQIQYDELVNGKPSSVLTVLDALGDSFKNE